MTEQLRGLIDLIKDKEARGSYDTWNDSVRLRGNKPLTQMTVAEVMALQRANIKLNGYSAAGGLQIVYSTLKEEVGKGTVALTDTFDQATQDKLFVSRLRFRGLDKWMAGGMSDDDFGTNIAKEWAAFPVLKTTYNGKRTLQPGDAYYGGTLNNPHRSPVPVEQVRLSLKNPGHYDPTLFARKPGVEPGMGVFSGNLRERVARQNRPTGKTGPGYDWVETDGQITSGNERLISGPGGEPASPAAGEPHPVPDYRSPTGPGGGPALPSFRQAVMDVATDSFLVRHVADTVAAAAYEADPAFDVAAAVGRDGLDEHLVYLGRAKSEEHYEALKRQVEREADRQTRMQAYRGWIAPVYGAFINPDTIASLAVPGGIVLGAASRGANMARSALRGTAWAGAFEVAVESGRAPLDPFSTGADSLTRVALGTITAGVFSGVLAGVAPAVARRSLTRGMVDDLSQAVGKPGLGETVDVGGVRYPLRTVAEFPGDAPAAARASGVWFTGDEIIVSDARMMMRFADEGEAMGAASPAEFATREAARTASMARQAVERAKAFLGDEAGAVGKRGQPALARFIPGEGEAPGRVAVDEAEIVRRWNAGEEIPLGPAEGTPAFKEITPVMYRADAFASPDEAVAAVRDAAEQAMTARGQNEFELNLPGQFDSKWAKEGWSPDEHRLRADMKAKAEAEADAALERFRAENNKILANKMNEAWGRLMDGPMKRLHRNALSGRVRDVADLLVGDGAFQTKAMRSGATLGPSVYARAKTWVGVTRRILDEENRLYSKYLGFSDKRIADVGRNVLPQSKRADGSGAISLTEWRDQVTKTLITGKPHAIPEINEMANVVRGGYDEFRGVAEELNVITTRENLTRQKELLTARAQRLMKESGGAEPSPEVQRLQSEAAALDDMIGKIKDEPGEDYYTRVWSKRVIAENREAFVERIVKPYMMQNNTVQVWEVGTDEISDQIKWLLKHGASDQDARVVELKRRMKAAPKGKSTWVWKTLKTDAEALDERANEFVDTILGEADIDDLAMLREPNRATFGRHRALNLPNAMLLKDGPMGNGIADFIDTNYALTMQIYAERMGPAIEMARTFGSPVNGNGWREGFELALQRARADEEAAWKARGGGKPDHPSAHPAHRAALDRMGLRGVRLDVLEGGAKGQRGLYKDGVIYLAKDADIGTLYHEALHAVWDQAGLLERLKLFRLSTTAKKFEDLLRLKDRPEYAEQFKGRFGSQSEEYLAKVFGYWSRREGDKTMAEFVDFANGHLREKLGADAPQISLTPREMDRLDAAFTGLRERSARAFEDHWAPMERDLRHLMDRATNNVIRNPNRWDNRSATLLKNWSNLAFMGMSAIPAMQDLGMLTMRHGAGKLWRQGLVSLDGELAAWARANVDEMRLAGAIMDVANASALSHFADTGMEATGKTKLESWARNLSSRYFLWNGLAPITTRMKEIDAIIRVHDTVEKIVRVSDGVATKDDLADLARFGISAKDAKAMAQQPIYQEDGGYWVANTPAWGDERLVRNFRAAIAQGNENTILMATAADKPTIVDGTAYVRKSPLTNRYALKLGLREVGDYWQVQSGLMTLPFQFWNYGIAAYNKVFLAGMDEANAQVLGGIAALVGMGWMTSAVRTENWDRLSFDDKIARAVDQSGVTGVLSNYADLGSTLTRAMTGFDPMPVNLGGPRNPSGLDALTIAGGAGASVLRNAGEGILGGDANRLSWALPFRNHLLVKDIFDSAVDGLERRASGQ